MGTFPAKHWHIVMATGARRCGAVTCSEVNPRARPLVALATAYLTNKTLIDTFLRISRERNGLFFVLPW